MALRFSGRFSVTQAIPSAISTRTVLPPGTGASPSAARSPPFFFGAGILISSRFNMRSAAALFVARSLAFPLKAASLKRMRNSDSFAVNRAAPDFRRFETTRCREDWGAFLSNTKLLALSVALAAVACAASVRAATDHATIALPSPIVDFAAEYIAQELFYKDQDIEVKDVP